jgi:hypothetical protein
MNEKMKNNQSWKAVPTTLVVSSLKMSGVTIHSQEVPYREKELYVKSMSFSSWRRH